MSRKGRFTGYGIIQPGAKADKFDKPKPSRPARSTATPEKTPAWKERQAKIDVAKLRNSGARSRKSGRV